MLIQYFHHFALFIVFMFYIDKSTLSMIFRDKSIRRFERGIATKYLIFPQGSNVQVRNLRSLQLFYNELIIYLKEIIRFYVKFFD